MPRDTRLLDERPVGESNLVRLAQHAEALGASALVADEGIDRDLYVTLTAIAVATSRILLVPAITNPHSRHPVATAAALASLAEVAPGRVVTGLGAGGNLVFGPMGINPSRPYSALAESVDVIRRLLNGEVVHHDGEFTTVNASIAWSSGPLPLAIAGRGKRVERLAAAAAFVASALCFADCTVAAAEADWVILAGKAVDDVESLIERLRAQRADGPQVIWNPATAWRPEHIEEIRSHFSYMTIDLPAEEREALGISDDDVATLRRAVLLDGPVAAARHVPNEVVQRYAIVGDRDEVVERLSSIRQRARPELIAFSAHEYTLDFIEEVARIANDSGVDSSGADALSSEGRQGS